MYSVLFRTLLFYLVFSFFQYRDNKIYNFIPFIWIYSIIQYEEPLIYFILITILVITLDKLKKIILKNKEYNGKYSNVIINNGKINFSTLNRLNYSFGELINELKSKEVYSIKDISLATLYNNKIYKLKIKDKDPIPLIVDGVINFNSLEQLNKDNTWIEDILKDNMVDLDNIMYAFFKNDKCFIIKN